MTATTNEPTMTIAEIKAQFDGEWVLLKAPYWNDRKEIVRGIPIAHSRDRNEVDTAAMRPRPKPSVLVYIEPMREEIAINIGLFF